MTPSPVSKNVLPYNNNTTNAYQLNSENLEKQNDFKKKLINSNLVDLNNLLGSSNP